jgi:BlaR1 peptidase M56
VDRDLVLAGLTSAVTAIAFLAAALRAPVATPPASGRRWEATLWRTLWRPVVPVVLVVSVLIGWAIQEPPQSDERLPLSIIVLSVVFVGVWMRAVIRAAIAIRRGVPPVAGTVGLWRPRVVLSTELITALDSRALDAIAAHERAHVRHRDPFRICVAQFVTDLQWPWPAARERFGRWRYALELARDQEAREQGADGADLAAGILVAARLQRSSCRGASLIDPEHDLETRIARLLDPLPLDDRAPIARTPIMLFPASAFGVLSGLHFGEAFVQTIVRWMP